MKEMDTLDITKKRSVKGLVFVVLSILVCAVSGFAFFSDSEKENLDIKIGSAEAIDFAYKITGSINDNTEITVASSAEDIHLSITEENNDYRDLFRDAKIYATWKNGTDINRVRFLDQDGNELSDVTYDEESEQIIIPLPGDKKLAAGTELNHYIKVLLDEPYGNKDSIRHDTLTFHVHSNASVVLNSWAEELSFDLTLHTNMQKPISLTVADASKHRDTYFVGDDFNPENLILTVTYDDGLQAEITYNISEDCYYIDKDDGNGKVKLLENDFEIKNIESLVQIIKDENGNLTQGSYPNASYTEYGTTVACDVEITCGNLIMQSWTNSDTTDFHAFRSTVTEVEFVNTYCLPEGFDKTADNGPWDVSRDKDGSVMAYMDGTNVYICANVGKEARIIANENSGSIFDNFNRLTAVYKTENLNTSTAKSMSNMFYGCDKLTAIYGIEDWDVSNVNYMTTMFSSCASLEQLDLSSWNVENVETFYHMFSYCCSLTSPGNLSDWDVGKGENFHSMFYCCCAMTSLGDLSDWDVSNATQIAYMFTDCEKLLAIGDLSNWKVGKAGGTEYMFSGCKKITTLGDLSDWNVSNVKRMTHMFSSCYKLEALDLSDWNVSNVTEMDYMFNNCESLTSVGYLSDWNVSKVELFTFMFGSCKSLESIHMRNWECSSLTDNGAMFSSCSSLTELTIPKSMQIIGGHFAANCAKLTTIEFLHEATDALTITDNVTFIADSPHTADNLLKTYVLTNNSTIKDIVYAHDWKGDYRTLRYNVTFLETEGGTLTGEVTNQQEWAEDTLSMHVTITPDTDYLFKTYVITYTVDGNAERIEVDDLSTFKMPWADITIMPVFEGQSGYSIAFDSNGGNGTMENMELEPGETKVLTANVFTRTGYTFSGWSKTSDGAVEYADKASVTDIGNSGETITLYAIWKANSGRVYYYPNGGTAKDEYPLLTSGTYAGASATYNAFSYTDTAKNLYNVTTLFTRTGYHVPNDAEAWLLDSAASGTYINQASQNMSSYALTDGNNLKCYANWKPNTYTIAFKANGGSGTMSNLSMTYDTAKALTANKFTKSGYTFKGWSTSSSATTATYTNKQSVKNLTATNNGTVTLYAVWQGEPVMKSWKSSDTTDFHAYKSSVSGITFLTSYSLPSSITHGPWDVSAAGDGSVMAYMVGTQVYICSNVGSTANVIANPTSKYAFYGFTALTKVTNAGNLDTSRATTVDYMFYNCGALTTIDVSSWNLSKLQSMKYFFGNCNNLTSLNVSNWNVSGVTSMQGAFVECNKLTTLDVSDWNISNVTNMSYTFAYCNSLKTLDVSNWNTAKITTLEFAFRACSSLTALDVSDWNTGKITNLNNTFYGLTLKSLDVSSWNVSSLVTFTHTFSRCTNLTSLNLTSWDLSNVTSMMSAFQYCESLKTLGDVSNWNVSKIHTFISTFEGCKALTTLNVSKWNVSSATNTNSMFQNCYVLASLDVSDWNVSNLNYMTNMFLCTYELKTIDISSWDCSNVTRCKKAFWGSGITTLTIPASLTSIEEGFAGICYNLTSITFLHSATDSIVLADAGYTGNYTSNNYYSSGETFGPFYYHYSGTKSTRVYTVNNTVKAHNWSTDKRSVSFGTVTLSLDLNGGEVLE